MNTFKSLVMVKYTDLFDTQLGVKVGDLGIITNYQQPVMSYSGQWVQIINGRSVYMYNEQFEVISLNVEDADNIANMTGI